MITEAEYQAFLVNAIVNQTTTSHSDTSRKDTIDQFFDVEIGNGLSVYRNNWFESAHKALSVSFPTVQKLLGNDNFRALCQFACKTIPKTEFDWGDWAIPNDFVVAVADFLAHQQVSSLPYVIESAKLDGLVFLSQRAKDPKLNRDSIAILNEDEGHRAVLHIADAVQIAKFSYPVDKLFLYCHVGEGDIQELKKAFNVQKKYFVRVRRTEFKPIVEVITENEYLLLLHAKNQYSVEGLFEKANELEIDFAGWLGNAINDSVVIGATLIKCDGINAS